MDNKEIENQKGYGSMHKRYKIESKKPPKKQVFESELGLEGPYAAIKEKIIFNKKLTFYQKAILLFDLEKRESFDHVIEDRKAAVAPELILQPLLALRSLEGALQEDRKNFRARAKLVEYLVLSSYKGSGVFEDDNLIRAENELKILKKNMTPVIEGEVLRLNVALSGFLNACPGPVAGRIAKLLNDE
jgi:hypothetical protein